MNRKQTAYALALGLKRKFPMGLPIEDLEELIRKYIGDDKRTVETYIHLTIEKYDFIVVKKHNGETLCFTNDDIENKKPITISQWAKGEKKRES